MLIAQITDIHLGFDPDNPAEYNRKRLDEVLDVLIDGPNRPDLLLATGDVTDRASMIEFFKMMQRLITVKQLDVVTLRRSKSAHRPAEMHEVRLDRV